MYIELLTNMCMYIINIQKHCFEHSPILQIVKYNMSAMVYKHIYNQIWPSRHLETALTYSMSTEAQTWIKSNHSYCSIT